MPGCAPAPRALKLPLRRSLAGDVMPISQDHYAEKIEAYNVAIAALDAHEPGSDCDLKMAARMRNMLARKLEREITRWVAKFDQGELTLDPTPSKFIP